MRTCGECGRQNDEDLRFCGFCGEPLTVGATPDEVRKTVTVVFCDLTGSTSLGERLDPESLRRLMTRYFEEMKAVLERHGGTVEKFIGDAVMAVFGIPVVHEDDALRAVRAAAEMRSTLTTLNEELERDRGVTIAARIGVNTGEVVAGQAAAAQSLVTGDTVNVAARLEQAAAPDQILIGEATLRLVRDAVTTEAIEPLGLKGKVEPVRAHALIEVAPGVPGVARHLDAPMVGRKAELEALEGAFERAARERGCVLATVTGPPGVGKSRLVDEFVSNHSGDAVVVHGRCLSYGDGITYWPVVEILTALAGIEDVDGPDEVRGKIGRLVEGSRDAAIVVERLAEFLGLAGATAAPEETHWAIRTLFEALAATEPFVPVFEDIHWAEPALLDLIEHVVTWSADAPIVLLCTARPELLEERPDWSTADHTAISLLLEPLNEDESDELIVNLTGSSALPDEIGPIVEAAEGNPLFLEQLVGMLIDDGHLRRDGDAWVVVGDLSALSVPPTITGMLEARLERLSRSELSVLERGAVEGRVFHWGSVTSLTDRAQPVAVGRDLLALVRRGLIGPAPALFGGGEAFRFRHALIRDAAYARVPKATRANLHERHARWVEGAAGDRVAEFEDVLAYHLEQAVELRSELGPLDEGGRELAAEAARRLASGGRRAAARGDVLAASTLLVRALRLLGQKDPARPDLLVRLGEALAEAGDAGAMEAFEQAREAAARAGDERVEIRAELARTLARVASDPEGATDELERLATDAIPILEGSGDDEGLARAWKALGEVALIRAQAERMVAAYERAALHAERAGDRVGLADALGWLALADWWGKTPVEDAVRRARALRGRLPEDRVVEAMTTMAEGLDLAYLGRFDDGRALHRHGAEILQDLGLVLRMGGMQDSAGRIELLAGDLAAAELEYRKGYDTLDAVGERGYLSTQAAELGRVLSAQGRLEEAEEMIRIAGEAASSDDIPSQVLIKGGQATVLARRGDIDGAIAFADEAMALLADSDFWDLRVDVLTDLADVHRLAGKSDEQARALRKALAVVEEKGVVPLIERFRSQLAELEDPSGP